MKKILLLEDNSFDADLVSRELKKKWPNVELVLASKLSEARDLFTDDTIFDIAIFDLKLPDGNGMELLTELRNKNFQTPIIVYTSIGSEEAVITAIKSGANNYISKKFDYEKSLPEQIEFTLKQSLKYKKSLNVLYIEHHKADIELTNHYLQKHAPHIHITNVSDGDIALSLLPKNSNLPCEYDLILLDYKLPGLNALEIIKIIREERKLFIPIIIVTGQGDEAIAAEALKIGVDDYVVKKEQYLLRLPSIIMNSYQHREIERQQHALKQSELKFRLLADYSSEWEFWVDQQKEYIYNSPVCEQTSGYTHQDFVKNKDLLVDITLPEYRDLVSEHFSKNLTDIHEPIEFKIKALDGSIKWISHFCRPVYDDDKNYLGQRGVNRDITVFKQQVKLLLKLNKAISNSSDIIFMTDAEGIINYINPVFTEKYGYNSDEIIGKTTPRILKSGNHPEVIYNHFWDNLKQKKSVVDFQFINKCKDGKLIEIEASANPIIDERGEISGYIGIQRDITQRKLANKALLESEEKHSLYVSHAPQGIFIANLDGKYIDVNPEACKMTGYSKEELLSMSLPNLIAPEVLEKVMLEFNQLLEKKEIHHEVLLRKKNGDDFYANIESLVLPGNRIMAYCTDITEKKRNELIQKIILNISNASQAVKDLPSLLKFIQKELGRLVDTKNFFVALYNEENDTIHLPYYEDEKDDVSYFPAKKTVTGYLIKQGKPLLLTNADLIKLETDELVKLVGDISEAWLGVPLKIKGKVTGALVIQTYSKTNVYSEKDKEMLEIISNQISISVERKQYEDELIKALEQAKESDRLKSAFLANMSHEIRTPMNGILGFSDLLKTPDLSSEKQQKYINLIEKSGKRMLSTINDIMDISKIEAGLMIVSKSTFNLKEKLEELFSFFETETSKKGLELTIQNNLIEDESFMLSDEQKVISIMTNLIKNAVKFTPSGNIEIGCSKKENFFEFYVKDTGIGIPANRQAFVFDRFVQADIEDKAVFEGSGLGLAISKTYVKMLGGEIWLTSSEGLGTTFFMKLPVKI
ncbi:PAS domain S-box protein [Lutibacter sp.]|uniref:PAS domain S-box protein n=1 Tax=Lutibacter sp. TaxID=1925666 RepID=UPI001A2CB665|nr:PAS domain S-box protein [Lutibacter sp.]MBI9041529.1 PAS domain S-box protein [Lutibacter sp.]